MQVAYFDCFSGISGDMILGALMDAGLDNDKLQEELNKLNLNEYELTFSKSIKQGITGTQFQVKSENKSDEHEHDHHEHEHEHRDEDEHTHHHSHRTLTDILEIIDESELDAAVKETAGKIFHRLAEAEAKIHNKIKNEIHFHEVGAVA